MTFSRRPGFSVRHPSPKSRSYDFGEGPGVRIFSRGIIANVLFMKTLLCISFFIAKP